MKGTVILALVALLATGLFVMAYGTVTGEFYPQHEQYWTGRAMNSTQGFSKHNADLMYGKDPPDDKWQGWVKVDVTGIPDNAVILSASLWYYVVAQSDPGPSTSVTLVGCDPVAAGPDELWAGIVSGVMVAPEAVTPDGWVERELNADGLAGVAAGLAQDWVAFGVHKSDNEETKGHARGHQAEKFRPYLRVTFAAADMAVEEIVAPLGEVKSDSLVVPAVVVANRGDVEVESRLVVTIGDGENEFYNRSVTVEPVPVGGSRLVELADWTADRTGGERVVSAVLELANDANPSDNSLLSWFDVVPYRPVPKVHWGWEEVKSLPAGLSQKPVRAGAWLAVDEATGIVYAARGSKTGDCYCYDPATGLWRALAAMPGPSNRGGRAVADGKGHLFMVRGSSTFEFWQYDIRANAWTRLPDVPAGNSGRKVKTGTDMVHVEQYGLDYIYLLKGPGCDFLRYNVQARTWQSLADAPAGAKAKWQNGSWLVFDGESTIYAHKAPVHEMWAYDLVTEAWTGPLPAMPYFPEQGPYKPRRIKDGGSAVWREGALWALKAGNTDQFFRYSAGRHEWAGREAVPVVGTSRTRARVGAGSEMASCPRARALYALKGNKTLEFWRYVMPPAESLDGAPRPMPATVQSGNGAAPASLSVSPNPVNAGSALLRLGGARGAGKVSVFDVQGRRVLEQEFAAGANAGSVALDLRGLGAGSYSVRVTGDCRNGTARLVIAR